MEKMELLPKPSALTFTSTRYLNGNSYFYSYKVQKNKFGGYSNAYKYFLQFLARNKKNQIGTKIYFDRVSILL